MSRLTTQPAGDTAEETVRSNMKVHGCHRLHTEKEERVMLLLVSAYLVRSPQCMPMTSLNVLLDRGSNILEMLTNYLSLHHYIILYNI